MWPGEISEPWQITRGNDATLTINVAAGGVAAALPPDGWHCHWRYMPSSDEHIVVTVDTSQAAQGQLILRLAADQTATMRRDGVFDVLHVPTRRTWVRGATALMGSVTRDV